MKTNSVYYHSPIGWLRIIENGTGITHLRFTYLSTSNPDRSEDQETPLLKAAIQQLSEYFTSKRKTFDLPLDPKGTPFQLSAWEALQNIPFGETRTYKQIAEAIDCPKGFRAVGLANNRNPIPIIIPCHRVIGANGKLVGFAGGLDVKKQLLVLEQQNTLF